MRPHLRRKFREFWEMGPLYVKVLPSVFYCDWITADGIWR